MPDRPRTTRRLLIGLALALLASPTGALAVAAFSTPQNAAQCGLSEGEGQARLLCWTPNDGYTITIGPRAGRPRPGTIIASNRDYVGPVGRRLPFGRTWRSWVYACVSRSTGLTCTNARGHGWWLGRFHGVRRF